MISSIQFLVRKEKGMPFCFRTLKAKSSLRFPLRKPSCLANYGFYAPGSPKASKSKTYKRDYTVRPILEGTLQAIQTVLPTDSEACEKLTIICKILTSKLNPEALQALKTGICHVDPHHKNIFLEKATGKITIYDFDFSGNGYLLYNVGSFCFYERHSEVNCNSFLEGYATIMPLPDAALELVPYFQLLRRLFHLGARSKNADGVKNPLWFPYEIAEKIKDIETDVYRLPNRS